jgi:hypothetical protein
LPHGKKLVEHWQKNLPAGEWAILKVILDARPYGVALEKIAAETKYTPSPSRCAGSGLP